MTPERCTPDRLPSDRLAFVEEIHQQFLDRFGQALAEQLDMPVKATPAGIDQVPMTEFLAGDHACVLAFDLAPMRGQAIAGLTSGLIFRVLDVLLGAPQTGAESARGTITDIEQHLLREFFGVLSSQLIEAWQPNGVALSMVSGGAAGQNRRQADPDDIALILSGKIEFAEAEETFRIAIPVLAVRLAALESERKAAVEAAGENAERTAVLEALSGATLELEAVLGGSSIRLGDLAVLQPGQILMLTRPAGSQLECLVNGKPKFRGEWIGDGSRQGLQVDEIVDAAATGAWSSQG
jgi:flagellar motor switch protein FliM